MSNTYILFDRYYLSSMRIINMENITFPHDVIISHGPGCNDGAVAAWCLWRLLPKTYRDKLSLYGGFYSNPDKEENENIFVNGYLHPNSPEGGIRLQEIGLPVVIVFVQPGQEIPRKLVQDKRVIILDLDMGDELVQIVENASFTLLVDHHDSTPLTISKYGNVLFEKYRHKFATYINIHKSESGASLSWKLTHSPMLHPFVEIVRIGDTWQWNDYPELQAKFVLEALYMKRAFRSFNDIENTFIQWNENFQSYVQIGSIYYESKLSLAKQIAKQCDLGFIELNDGTIYTVAYTQANILHSEVGSLIRYYAEKRFEIPIDLCVTWKYISYKGLVSVSLRDGREGLNLSFIARNIKNTNGKGGGHTGAAGFIFYGIENFHNFILREKP